MMLLTTRLRLDPDGKPHFPEAWMSGAPFSSSTRKAAEV